MSENYNYAEVKNEGLELVKDGSKEGVDAFVNFIQEDYSKLNSDDKNKIYNKMYNSGREAEDGIILRGEDNNGNGYLDVTEIWTESEKTPYQPIPKSSGRDSADRNRNANGNGTESMYERAYRNVRTFQSAAEGQLEEALRWTGYGTDD